MTFGSQDTTPRRPRILFYGDSGSGKTTTTASLPGKKAFFDCDRGYEPYVRQFENVASLYTESHERILAEIKELIRDPLDYEMVVIDPISTVARGLRQTADDVLRPRAMQKNPSLTDWDQVTSWGTNDRIASIMRNILARLRDVDLAVVVTARAKPLFRVGASKAGEMAREQIGITYDGPVQLDYDFDLVLEMRAVGNDRIARVVKSRGLKLGAEIEASSSQDMAEQIVRAFWAGAFTTKGKPMPFTKVEDLPKLDTQNRGPTLLCSTAQHLAIAELVKCLGFTPEQIARALRDRGVDEFSRLSAVQANEMLGGLEKLMAAQPSEVKPGETKTPEVETKVPPDETAPAETPPEVTTGETERSDDNDDVEPALQEIPL